MLRHLKDVLDFWTFVSIGILLYVIIGLWLWAGGPEDRGEREHDRQEP